MTGFLFSLAEILFWFIRVEEKHELLINHNSSFFPISVAGFPFVDIEELEVIIPGRCHTP